MMGGEQVVVERDVEASVVPSGTRVTLEKGETATITPVSYTHLTLPTIYSV